MHKIFANTLFIGKQIISLPSCHSTNDLLAEMAEKNTVFEGAVVITENQTRGKGQRGNTWQTEAGKNLTFSVLLKPKFLKPSLQFELNRIVSLALYDIIKNECPQSQVHIKWPNDIYVKKRKIAGILIENSLSQQHINQSIVGIGLNVNQITGLMETATSLKTACNVIADFDLNILLSNIVARLEHYYLILRGGDYRLIHELYESKLYKKDAVAFYEDINGKFNGIIRGTKPEGELIIEDDSDNLREYQFKEVKFLP